MRLSSRRGFRSLPSLAVPTDERPASSSLPPCQTLLHALLAHLATVPPRPPRFAPADAPAPTPSRKGALGRVNPVNKHLEIRGSWQQATRAWLVEQGM